jgi:hypothetical protein
MFIKDFRYEKTRKMTEKGILLLLGALLFNLLIFLYALLIKLLKVKVDDEYIKGQKKKLWGMQ